MAGDATHPTDWTSIDSTVDFNLIWPKIERIIHDLAAVWNATEFSTDTAPNKQLLQFYISDDTLDHFIRIGQDGTSFRIDKNTGTDATPVWVNLLSINITTLALTLPAGLTLGGALSGVTGLTLAGALDLGGFNITNVAALTATTVNGVDPAAHATRHAPGGSDAIALGIPVAIGSANAAGAAATLPRSDHVHAGVSQIDVDAAGNVQGNIDLASGDGIKITLAGNTATFSRQRVHTKINGGDDTVTAATETIVQDSAGTPNLLQAQLTAAIGADGAKDWLASFSFTVLDTSAAANDLIVRLRQGSLGTLSDALVGRWDFSAVASTSVTVAISDVVLLAPAANDYITVSIEGVGNLTVRALAADLREPELEVKAVAN